MLPETKYAKSGDINIAYQVVGDGPLDLVYVPGWVSNVEYAWEEPSLYRFLMKLASFSRLILFDKRGTGLSDKVHGLPTLEQRMDDVRAVMDAVGSRKAALFGVSEGGPLCTLFAATYPERTTALIVYGSYAKRIWDPEYPWAPTEEQRQMFFDEIKENWGKAVGFEARAPSLKNDTRSEQWWASYLRRSASPGDALALTHMNSEIDIRNILPSIYVPSLILHRKGDLVTKIEEGRYIASRIPNSRLVEFEGIDHLPWVGDFDGLIDEMQLFLTGKHTEIEHDRILATVLFTDIVSATEHALELGDKQWKDLLNAHNNLVRSELARFRGREIDTAGDGFFAVFDGPARAIRCACAIREAVRRFGLEIRAGLHTGECELMGDSVSGVAVHIGARVMAKASTSEVLVSSTVKDLIAGSGITFQSKGKHQLKGFPGEWELFSVGKF